MPASKKRPDAATTRNAVTTTGRRAEPQPDTPSPTSVQPGSDPVRRANPDKHGPDKHGPDKHAGPAATQDTAASKLEKEAEQGEENRY